MIRELRGRHRLMITLLAVVTPVLFVAALAGRTPMPTGGLPSALAASTLANLVPIGAEWTLLMNPPIRGRYLALPGDSIPTAIRLTPDGPGGEPDLLLYWAETVGDSVALPPEARLLGPLDARQPVSLPRPEGYLILYSLAHRERLAVARLPAVEGGAPTAP